MPQGSFVVVLPAQASRVDSLGLEAEQAGSTGQGYQRRSPGPDSRVGDHGQREAEKKAAFDRLHGFNLQGNCSADTLLVHSGGQIPLADSKRVRRLLRPARPVKPTLTMQEVPRGMAGIPPMPQRRRMDGVPAG